MENEGAVAITCDGCGMFLFLPSQVPQYTCSKCKVVALLEDKVRQLEECISTLRSIRENEVFVEEAERTLLNRGDGEDLQQPIQDGDTSQIQETNPWRRVTVRNKKTTNQPEGLRLQNRFQPLSLIQQGTEVQQEQQGQLAQRACDPPPQQRAPPKPQRRRVVVVGDSLLRGTEALICKPDKMNREVCCLPGAKVRDVTERLTRIIRPTDYNPFLLVHVGTNDTAKRSFPEITRAYEEMGRKLKDLGGQVVISSLLPVAGHGPRRERIIAEVNNWLRRWCRKERFGFLDHGLLFHADGLLGNDGVHLTTAGRNLFAKRLENLIRRALN